MQTRDLARHYMRYWPVPDQLSDNAPSRLLDMVGELRRQYDNGHIHAALAALATIHTSEPVTTGSILRWLADNPGFARFADEVMKAKKPPATFPELLDRAYRAAMTSVLDAVREHLKTHLTY